MALIAVLAVPVAEAAVLYSTSFENPPFTTGAIAGQDGWSVFGPGISTVSTVNPKTGTQDVFVDGGTASQSGPFHANSSTGPLVDLSADIAIFTSTSQTAWQFAATGPSLVGFIGGIDILANNNIQAITAGFPIIGTFPRATAFNSTAWHHIDLLLNMSTQRYNITLDGTTLASNVAFCGTNGVCTGALVPTYADGFFDSFGGGGGNDSGYMDNFLVQTVTGSAPEPATFALLSLALAGLGFSRRKLS